MRCSGHGLNDYDAQLRALQQEYEARVAQNNREFNEAIFRIQEDFRSRMATITAESPSGVSTMNTEEIDSKELGNPSTFKSFLDRAERSLTENTNHQLMSRLKEENHILKLRCSHYEERIHDLEVAVMLASYSA